MSPPDESQNVFSAGVDWTTSTRRREGIHTDPANPSQLDAPDQQQRTNAAPSVLSSREDRSSTETSSAPPLPREISSDRRPSILKRPPETPTSPTTRARGYSLRRVLFAGGMDRPGRSENIELGEAGPSAQRGSGRLQPHFEDAGGKKSPGVVVSALDRVPTYELPPRPTSRSKQTRFAAISLPNYERWVQTARRRGPFKKIDDAINNIKKRIEKANEIPPSKDGRHIHVDCRRTANLIDERRNKEYISNLITSSRYTAWNFLPKQLAFQFGKLANFYFLMISILQMIPGLSTTGNYTTIVPLLVFICISMGKEGYDDLRRHKLDKAENNKPAHVLSIKDDSAYGRDYDDEKDGIWQEKKWQEVRVGDIVRLKRDDAVPADIILLHSDGLNGIAFIETMALDGETNLKAKQASPELAKACKDFGGLLSCNAHIVVEDPNLDLYNFDGRVTVGDKTMPLTTNEVVYRGSILRNTSQAIGIVINSGEECKIRMNANKNPRIKFPSLQVVANKVVVIVVFFVLCLASFMTIAYQVWYKYTEAHSWYLRRARVASGPILTSFIIMFNTMIPLSLYVSLEIIKIGQLILMHDIDMYDPVTDTPMEARTTTINEELGQVSYIFSDKTGTLTDNIMRFRKLSVAGAAWLHDNDLIKDAEDAEKLKAKMAAKKKGKGVFGRATKTLSGDSHFSEDYSMSGAPEHPAEQTSLSRRGSVAWKSSARPAKGQPELRTEDMLQYLQHHPHGVFARKARFFLLSLALCHTCLPETKDDGTTDFQAASPDELALVRAAQDLGYMVVDRAAQTITLKSHPNGPDSAEIVETYEVLDVIEFSSKRKRMSIIVRFPDGRRCIFCKGADTIVMKRLKHAQLALRKVEEVERRASVRKSLEVESALRKMSDAHELPRGSMDIKGRRSVGGGVPRALSITKDTAPVREQLDTWLRDQEQDVDLTDIDHPSAYSAPRLSSQVDHPFLTIPRASMHSGGRRSTSSAELGSPLPHDYYDGLVDEEIAMDEAAVFERCFQHIDDFATEGLRTLLYGYKFLDEQEYLGWKKVYHDATTSLVNRQVLIERAGDLIEKDFELAGATAIEDKLQNGVPETIDKLRRANIRMWMLTGDKRETAINIGHSCRLIKDYSHVIILDSEAGKVEHLMAQSLLELQQGNIPHSVVVVDGQTLSMIESDEILALLFFDLTVIADSVICCRASPSQKALLVRSIREKVKGSVTLAIGDGANDIAMIQEAHVGIGITGKEGLQAARTSDYAIAQFRFLQKLLLVHGRYNYIRTAKYILGTFWKEMLFYLTQALYQRFNGYTGTSLFESWSMSMFNTLFTSLPVIFLGVFEQDLRPSTLLAVPELYTYGQQGQAFNIKKYFWWMFMATGEALMVFFLMYGLYGLTDTKDVGIFAMGDLCFTICVLAINTKLLFIEMHTKTIMSVIGWFLSVGGWTLWNLILNFVYSQKESTVYSVRGGLLGHFGNNPTWWIILILEFLFFLVFELGIMAGRKALWPNDTDVFQILEQDKLLAKRFEDAARGVDAQLARDEEQAKREGEVENLLAARGSGEMPAQFELGGSRKNSMHAGALRRSFEGRRKMSQEVGPHEIASPHKMVGHELTTIFSNGDEPPASPEIMPRFK